MLEAEIKERVCAGAWGSRGTSSLRSRHEVEVVIARRTVRRAAPAPLLTTTPIITLPYFQSKNIFIGEIGPYKWMNG